MEKELELLNKIKNELIDKGDLCISLSGPGLYEFKITPDDWHKIFKTDEYNKLTKKQWNYEQKEKERKTRNWIKDLYWLY